MSGLLTLLPSFLLCLVRMTCFFFTAPIFSYKTVPPTFKIGLGVCLAYLSAATLNDRSIVFDPHFILLVMKESVVGLSMGLVAGLLFFAVQMAGSFIDLQMGLSMASLLDPQNGTQSPLSGELLNAFMILFLLSVNAHHMLINGVLDSYRLIPLKSLGVSITSGTPAEFVTHTFLLGFTDALQMSLPIVGSLFLVDVAVGVVARTVPQLNVFVVGVPLKIGVGFVLFVLVLPLYISFFQYLFENTTNVLQQFVLILGG